MAEATVVYKIFLSRIDAQLIDSLALHAIIANESRRHMGVAKKTNAGVLIGEACSGIEIVENVTPLLGRIEGRMDDREIAHLPLQLQRDFTIVHATLDTPEQWGYVFNNLDAA